MLLSPKSWLRWKEAIITPVLKNGDRELLKNYRPVSCLAAASKLLEKIVCAQVSEFFEVKNLIPNNQHGFRSNRSTMTAWCEMQEDWAKNTESKNMTGILLWDLSAAFDTLDPEILCKKLKIYYKSNIIYKLIQVCTLHVL